MAMKLTILTIFIILVTIKSSQCISDFSENLDSLWSLFRVSTDSNASCASNVSLSHVTVSVTDGDSLLECVQACVTEPQRL